MFQFLAPPLSANLQNVQHKTLKQYQQFNKYSAALPQTQQWKEPDTFLTSITVWINSKKPAKHGQWTAMKYGQIHSTRAHTLLYTVKHLQNNCQYSRHYQSKNYSFLYTTKYHCSVQSKPNIRMSKCHLMHSTANWCCATKHLNWNRKRNARVDFAKVNCSELIADPEAMTADSTSNSWLWLATG